MKSAVAFFIPMLAAACANAHGYVADLIIADKHYKGNEPAGAKNPSVIRQVSDVSPVKGATNTNINCGLNATPASLVANANPGDKVSFSWKGGDGSNVRLPFLHDQLTVLMMFFSGLIILVLCWLIWLLAVIRPATSLTQPLPSGSKSRRLGGYRTAIGHRLTSVRFFHCFFLFPPFKS